MCTIQPCLGQQSNAEHSEHPPYMINTDYFIHHDKYIPLFTSHFSYSEQLQKELSLLYFHLFTCLKKQMLVLKGTEEDKDSSTYL